MPSANSNSGSGRAQIHAYVDSDQKQRWVDHIEQSYEVDTMSEFLRVAVEKYIQQQNESRTPSDTDSQPSQAIEDHTSQVLDAVGGLSGQLEDVQQRLSVVENEMTNPPEITDLSSKVLTVLPPLKPYTESWFAQKDMGGEAIAWEGTVEQIGVKLGMTREYHAHPDEEGNIQESASPVHTDEDSIKNALNQLQSDTSLVEHEMVEGELRYWRDE